jgi:hypothetical protein
MRPILHAKLANGDVARRSRSPDSVLRTKAAPEPRDPSVDEFEAALTKARAAWSASRGSTRTAIYNGRLARQR